MTSPFSPSRLFPPNPPNQPKSVALQAQMNPRLLLPLACAIAWLLLMGGVATNAQPSAAPDSSTLPSAEIEETLRRDLPLPGALPPQRDATPSLKVQLQTLEARWKALRNHYDGRPQVSLPKALEIGLRRNPILAQSFAELEAAEWTTTAVRREWLPSLYFSFPNNAPWTAAVGTQIGTQDLQQFFTSPRLNMSWTFLDPTRTPRLGAGLATLQ